MDPAQEIELHAQRYHKPMDELIARGDSPMQQFYSGATVFVTGGSGFLGKQLIEKLLRSCAIKKMYLLTRQKGTSSVQERLEKMLEECVFDRLREQRPQFADKVVAIKGDVAEIKLGITDADWALLTNEVNFIFHEAATISFTEPLRKATLTNVRGTREVMKLAKECTQLKQFVQVSTTFAHATSDRVNTYVLEEFYPCPVPPDVIISLAEDVDATRLDNLTQELIKGWPNTYTFTKAIAEELVRRSAGDLPVCVIRPSIVLPAYFEPNPGWLDISTVIGPSGILVSTGLGVLRVYLIDYNCFMSFTPVDYVNNATIAAAWDSSRRKENGEEGIPIYNIAKEVRSGMMTDSIYANRERLCTPKAVWHANTIVTSSKYLYFILSWFLHFIPAYTADFVCKVLGKELPEGMPSFVNICKKVDKLAEIYNYFIQNRWQFKDFNIQTMLSRMSDVDKTIFNCDVNNIDLEEYALVWVIGIRKYVIKDGLKGTVEGLRKQKYLRIAHYLALAIYAYTIWFLLSTMYALVKFIFSYVF